MFSVHSFTFFSFLSYTHSSSHVLSSSSRTGGKKCRTKTKKIKNVFCIRLCSSKLPRFADIEYIWRKIYDETKKIDYLCVWHAMSHEPIFFCLLHFHESKKTQFSTTKKKNKNKIYLKVKLFFHFVFMFVNRIDFLVGCLPADDDESCDISKQLLRVRFLVSGEAWPKVDWATTLAGVIRCDADSLAIQSVVSIAFEALRLKCSRKLSICTSIELGVLAIA